MTTICRICLGNSSDMLPLFETLIGEKQLIEIILSTLGVVLDSNEDFPRFICRVCFKSVNLLYEFYQKLIETQSLLNQWIKEGKPIVGIVDRLNSQDDVKISEQLDAEGRNSGIGINNSKIVEVIQQQIEHEPITIKHEPVKSDEEMDDNETTNGNDMKNSRSEPPKKRRKWKPSSKVVETIPNKCYICGPILKNHNEFNSHLDSHSEMLPYECKQCSTADRPIILSTELHLNKHIESHGFGYPCEQCPLRFKTSNSIAYHMRTVHTKKTNEYNCETCGRVFTNQFVYRNHMRGHLSLKLGRYKCEICRRLFKSLQDLQRHHPSHIKKRQYVCQWCSTTFQSAVSSLVHVEKCVHKKL